MPAHERDVGDWTAIAQLHSLLTHGLRVEHSRAADTTRLRVLDELAELKAVTKPPALLPRHSLSGLTIRGWFTPPQPPARSR